MRKILAILIAVLMALSIAPAALAVGVDADTGTNVDVPVGQHPPLVFTDSTARMWCPNDETWYTANYFNTSIDTSKDKNKWKDCFEGYGYEVPLRQNYAFTGEKIRYFVLVYDKDGANDIDNVSLVLSDGTEIGAGACAAGALTTNAQSIDAYDAYDKEGNKLDGNVIAGAQFDPSTMKSYACTLIVQSGWKGEFYAKVKATDDEGNIAYGPEDDYMVLNPAIQLSVDGTVDFGVVVPGAKAYSDTVVLKNVAVETNIGKGDYGGVLMDMYIAADDYFTDPVNGNAICPNGNGIKHDRFSYYATKGSVDSGSNDNSKSGIGENDPTKCKADPNMEYTNVTSYSGHVEDMCRIINHRAEDSILAQGAEMSLTFRLDVPKPCEGSFTDGKFRFWGEVI